MEGRKHAVRSKTSGSLQRVTWQQEVKLLIDTPYEKK
jgi:hypothetical protein